MKNSIEVGGWKITRFIQKDKKTVKAWGKVWFRFKMGNGLLKGEACVSQIHLYVPQVVLDEIKKTWKRDFE